MDNNIGSGGQAPGYVMALRCMSCGAPLLEGQSGSEYTKCEYCGVVQKIVDSRRYIESFRGELYSWLKDLVPAASSGSVSMDPVARHNIFVYNVKPRVIAEYISVKSKLTMLMSKCMLFPPFYRPQDFGLQDTSRKAFEGLARVESVKDLAVNDEDKAFHEDVVATYTLYSYVLLMADLIARRESIEFLDKNFTNVLKALEDRPQRKVEYLRMQGLYNGYHALDRYINGDISGARGFTGECLKKLDEALSGSAANPIFRPAILSEISAALALGRLEETAVKLTGAGRPMIEYMPALEKFMGLAEKYKVERKLLCDELIDSWCQAVEAKNGLGKVYSMGMSADLFMPFWEVSLTYTFRTGVMLWAKGVKVEDKLLVAAACTMARESVTDIFKTHGDVNLMDRLAGNESTLTGSGIVGLLKNIAPNPIPSASKIFPPMATNEMAEAAANNYLSGLSRRFGGKVTLGSVRAERIIYLPAVVTGGRMRFANLEGYAISLDRCLDDILVASL
jgi:hypothetical protein